MLDFILTGTIDRISIVLAIAGAILLLGAVLSMRRLQVL
jgi:hypothetical protein